MRSNARLDALLLIHEELFHDRVHGPKEHVSVSMANVFTILGMLYLSTAAATGLQTPEIKQAVNDIVSACAIGPTESMRGALTSKLEEFLQKSIEKRLAKSTDLIELLRQFPIDTDESLAQLKDVRARQMFFSIYFDCIRQQVRLKLKSFDIDIE